MNKIKLYSINTSPLPGGSCGLLSAKSITNNFRDLSGNGLFLLPKM